MKLLWILLFTMYATSALAEMPPLPAGAALIAETECIDDETQEKGTCYVFSEENGDIWLVFVQKKELMFQRHVPAGQPYINTWVNPMYNTY